MKKWVLLTSLMSSLAFAEEVTEPAVLNTGNTAWMMMSTALVLLMTPIGLALFYSGMTRVKNVLNTYLMVFGAFTIAFIAWVVAGFSIAFGTVEGSLNEFIGGFSHIMLSGISWSDLSADSGETYPKFVFIVFQGTFAAITIAIAAGSVIERMKFSTWMIFAFIWTIVVYAPIVHMVWGGGYLFNEGALDFAGGTVVHMNGGLAGLVLAILLGKRNDYPKTAMKPASIILTAVGAGLLWFGWYGFNGGSAFGANEIAGLAYLTTTIATSIAAITWLIIETIIFKKATLLGAASGAIAGLVAITPAAGFVDVSGSLIIGIVGSIVAFFGVAMLKKKLGYDDSLDAFGIHFLAGMWGAVATGIFALNDKDLLWDGPLKDADDRLAQIFVQFESIVVVGIYTLIGTIVVYYIASMLTKGARVTEEEERQGLDESLHGERGFNL
ncbi:ammonium transporter [Aliarcobacter butzleri]|jgi:Amt family ammonium transporter|uniref:Ammonium transporter n=5 Tax=Aliarcobacter butzleri TaxID=28197 RepID=A0AAP4UN03_9BACT|nr:ammonium transporter [Aliarcobacter butzleri]KLD99441.1 ammonia channel protein [Aliarcobacter butzleri L348]KLE05108.1 ammonia channel protein [Aliarcobacter butzleri L353]KLE06442.1 ammonia channel protein [Aliarcobacter butzleri L352]KLE10683.1 ammonia channel protein [Aliarcobacter butzleri L354]MCG3653521.1 ammonium transporter [Aliarcobacter butzleri]